MYSIEYFIDKFTKIPENGWTTSANFESLEKRDIYGWCDSMPNHITAEAKALVDIMAFDHKNDPFAAIIPIMVNDGEEWAKKFGKTPKQRVLNYLNAIKRISEAI